MKLIRIVHIVSPPVQMHHILVTVTVTAYSLVKYYQRFGVLYFHLYMLGLVFDPGNGGSKLLRNVGTLPHYTESTSRNAEIAL
jgi:hypothetical protein